MTMRGPITALVPLTLMACAQTPVPAPSQAAAIQTSPGDLLADKIERGRAIASRECASCHGLDNEEAEWPDAPALRHMLADYDSETLNEDFRQSVRVGHPGMPQFLYGPKTADLLVSYLVSIQEPETPPSED